MSTATNHKKRSHRSERLRYNASGSRARIATSKQNADKYGIMGWLKQRALQIWGRRETKANAGND